jgi:uncharacterized YigZ family protein
MSPVTITREFHAELEEKRSRFIAFLLPYSKFEARLKELRSDHTKAAHHVTAYRRILSDSRIKEIAKDDGEPSGTSGMPALKVLIGANLVDVAIIVVRYFGGIKLGTGGLSRAYAGVTKAAVADAELVPWQKIVKATLSCRFDQLSEIEEKISTLGLSVLKRNYHEEGLKITVEGPENSVRTLQALV